MDERIAEFLLRKLQGELGLDLRAEFEQLVHNPPDTVDAFTDAVLAAEGFTPAYADRELRRQVRERVEAAFHSKKK